MAVHLASDAFLFYVRQLPARRQLTIPADHASAAERPKSQEPHQTHGLTLRRPQIATSVPLRFLKERDEETSRLQRDAQKNEQNISAARDVAPV
jgi:hypothetical protein